jgi:hypothetical protein
MNATNHAIVQTLVSAQTSHKLDQAQAKYHF